MGYLVTIIIGAIAGWLGGMLYKGSGLGLIGNIIAGILGGFVGSWLLGMLRVDLSFGNEYVGAILTGAIGAVVVLFIANLVMKKK